jgi:hypothetical protein
MKRIYTFFATLALACLSVTPALAAPVFAPGGTYIPNNMVVCVSDATAGYTNSTATPSDITGATCAVPAYDGDYSKQYIETCFNADVTKATATNGAIGVFVNGALVTASKRFATSAAGQSDLSGCYTVARSSGAAQTVKLQGVSADTNLFTVANCQFAVRIIQGL